MKPIQRSGFTLIEVLVVISIIAVLSGIGMVGYKSIRRSMDENFVRSEVNQLRKALLDYKSLNRVVITRGKDKDGVVWFDGYSEQATPSNAKIVDALSSPNDKGEVAFSGINQTRLDASGQLMDKWDTPYIFKVIFIRGKAGVPLMVKSKGYAEVSDISVYSAGYDKQESMSMLSEWWEGVNVTMPRKVELLSPVDDDPDNVYPTN